MITGRLPSQSILTFLSSRKHRVYPYIGKEGGCNDVLALVREVSFSLRPFSLSI